MVSAQALTETLAAVEKQAKNGTGLWEQGDWAEQTPCGTAGCFAGWRAILDGYTVLEDTAGRRAARRLVNPETGHALPLFVVDVDGFLNAWPDDGTTIARHAQQRFGLDEYWADVLFAINNTLPDLREIVADLIARDEESAGRDG